MTLAARFPRATRWVDTALLVAGVPWAFAFCVGLATLQRWAVRKRED